MASPAAAAKAEFTQREAARQSLIAISQSVPEIGARLPVRSPDGGVMANGPARGKDGAENYRAKLISISNDDASPDARPAACPPAKDGVAY
ncbi:hypothetical protein ACP4OV_031318 [Aristida adscensionis]